MIDPADRVLLVRLQFPDWTGWVLPGGGKEQGEDDVTAVKRELVEETGVPEVFVGPQLWVRTHYFEAGGWDGQRETVYLVPCHAFEVAPTMTVEELRSEGLVEHRWWTVAELEAAAADEAAAGTGVVVRPKGMADMVKQILEHGAPAEPWVIDGDR